MPKITLSLPSARTKLYCPPNRTRKSGPSSQTPHPEEPMKPADEAPIRNLQASSSKLQRNTRPQTSKQLSARQRLVFGVWGGFGFESWDFPLPCFWPPPCPPGLGPPPPASKPPLTKPFAARPTS